VVSGGYGGYFSGLGIQLETGTATGSSARANPSSVYNTPWAFLCDSGAASGYRGLIDWSKTIVLAFWWVMPQEGASVYRASLGSVGTTLVANTPGALARYGIQLRLERTGPGVVKARVGCRGSSGIINAASNASPIVLGFDSAISSITTGDTVEVTGVAGNTAANGIWTVGATTSNTIALVGSTGNGAYTSGGSAMKCSAEATLATSTSYRFFLVKSGSTAALYVGSISGTAATSVSGARSSGLDQNDTLQFSIENTGTTATITETSNIQLGSK